MVKPEAANVLREEGRRCLVAAKQLPHVRNISALLQELGNLMITLAQKFEAEGDSARARDQGDMWREPSGAGRKRRSDHPAR